MSFRALPAGAGPPLMTRQGQSGQTPLNTSTAGPVM